LFNIRLLEKLQTSPFLPFSFRRRGQGMRCLSPLLLQEKGPGDEVPFSPSPSGEGAGG